MPDGSLRLRSILKSLDSPTHPKEWVVLAGAVATILPTNSRRPTVRLPIEGKPGRNARRGEDMNPIEPGATLAQAQA